MSWTAPLRSEEIARLELRLLGSALADPDRRVPIVSRILGERPQFGNMAHAAIWRGIQELGPAADFSLVYQRMSDEAKRAVTAIGGVDRLEDAMEIGSIETLATTEYVARKLRSSAKVREAQTLIVELAQTIKDGRDPQETMLRLAESIDMARADEMRIIPRTVAQLEATQLAPPDAMLGNGILSRGDWGMIHAREGLGKTWITLELAASLCTGMSWYGLPVHGRFRVLVLSLEMGAYFMRDRFRKILDAMLDWLPEERLQVEGQLFTVTRDDLPYCDMLEPGFTSWLAEFCKANGIDVVILDPLSEFFHGAENSRKDVAPIVKWVKEFPSLSGGCTPALIQHERKQTSQGDQGDDASASIGSVGLIASARWSFRLSKPDKEQGAPYQLKCTKSNNAPMPDPIWLKREDDGRLSLTAGPSGSSDYSKREALKFLGTVTSACPEEIGAAVGMSKRWAERAMTVLHKEGQVAPVRAKREDGKGWRTLWTKVLQANERHERQEPYAAGDIPF